MKEQSEKTIVSESSTKTSEPVNKTIAHVNRTIKSFLLSKKLWMTVFGIVVMWIAYWKAVDYLFSFTLDSQITAFSGITRDFMFSLATIIFAFLGIEGVVNWKHGTETIVNQASSFIKEQKESKSEETKNVKIELTEELKHYIKEEGVNAPEIKPFSQQAIGDEQEGEYKDF